jgi:8-oxo-dGTP pyrophosphatase MutT (NUDIX family)
MDNKISELPFCIEQALAIRRPQVIENHLGIYMESAVLVPLFKNGSGYKILLTKRTTKVEAHKGQISFPGGAVDPTDASFEQTALREAFEEIGLRPQDVKFLGRLNDMLTMASNFVIHPFVGLIPYPYEFRLNSFEVQELVPAPLEIFLKPRNPATIESIAFEGQTYSSPAFHYEGHLIWGATARILINLAEIITEKIDLPDDVR